MSKSFEGDFGVRRNRQSSAGAVNDIDRFADQATRNIVLVLAVGHFQPGYHEQRGMHSNDHRDRACLAALVIFAHNEIAVLALGAVYGGDIAALDLHPIGAIVDPATVRVFHQDHAAGADEIAAVLLMPLRGRDAVQIDLVTAVDVFLNGSAIDHPGRNGLHLAHIAAPERDKLHFAGIGRQADRDVDPRHGGEHIGENPVAFRIAGDVVEQNRLVADPALIDIDDAADFLLAFGTADLLQLVGLFHGDEPRPQILLGHLPRPFLFSSNRRYLTTSR